MENNLTILIFSLIFLLSCRNPKETTETNGSMIESQVELIDTASKSLGDGNISMILNFTGIVRDMNKVEGCGWLIALEAGNGEIEWLDPITLDENYKVDGKTIVFNYVLQRRPSRCTLPAKPIEITKYIE